MIYFAKIRNDHSKRENLVKKMSWQKGALYSLFSFKQFDNAIMLKLTINNILNKIYCEAPLDISASKAGILSL